MVDMPQTCNTCTFKSCSIKSIPILDFKAKEGNEWKIEKNIISTKFPIQKLGKVLFNFNGLSTQEFDAAGMQGLT